MLPTSGMFTQGTQLYFLDPDGNGGNGSIVKVDCAKGISPLSAPRAQEDDNCLENTDGPRSRPIWGSLGTATINLDWDPRIASHVRIAQLYETRTTVHWVIGLSDGAGIPPTVGSDGFNLPDTRTWREFEAFVNDMPIDHQTNTYYSAAIPLQLAAQPGPIIPKVIPST